MIAAICSVALLLAPAPQDPALQDIAPGPLGLHYTVRATTAADNGGAIPLEVELRVEHPPRPRAVFQLPVWAPGSYRLQDFPGRISSVRALDAEGGELPVLRLNDHSWQVRHENQPALRLLYQVRLEERDRFMLRGELRRCITYEGPRVYMYLRDHKDTPCHVSFELPDGWAVGSGLIDRGEGRYFAQDYDFLADCPVKLGVFQKFGFTSHGVPIDVVLDGPGDVEFDHAAWVGNIKKITDAQGDIFGGFPFERYTFLYTAAPRGGGGGLEHLTSTAIGVPARSLPRSAETGMGVTAHEFFHLWNVKRIRPRALGPFDYTRPVRTTTLWLMEGVTSYYTEVSLARAGLRSPSQFWEAMAGQIGSFESAAARPHVSSAMASSRAWNRQPTGRSLNYYNSGEVIGLLLDLEIRGRTQNRRSLDDVMRALYVLCRDRGRGFDESELPIVVSNVVGGDMSEWFDRYVSGTVTRPYVAILAHAGLRYEEQRSSRKSLRGVSAMARGEERAFYYIDPSAAGQARRSGRVLVIGDREVDAPEQIAALALDEITAPLDAGSTVALEIESLGGRRVTLNTEVEQQSRVRVSLSPDAQADELALAIRAGITTGQPGHPGR